MDPKYAQAYLRYCVNQCTLQMWFECLMSYNYVYIPNLLFEAANLVSMDLRDDPRIQL